MKHHYIQMFYGRHRILSHTLIRRDHNKPHKSGLYQLRVRHMDDLYAIMKYFSAQPNTGNVTDYIVAPRRRIQIRRDPSPLA